MQALNIAEISDGFRQGRELVKIDVGYAPAFAADKVVVPFPVGIEPRAAADRIHAADQSDLLQRSERPIDGIVGDGRHFLADPLENSVGIGMLSGLRHLAEDLHALMRHAQAGSMAGIPESFEPALDFN
jgi:hypothetical protein